MKKNFNLFNKPDTTVVITSFPDPKDGTDGNKGFNAVAWHSQKTLAELSRHAPVLVLAETRNDDKSQIANPKLKNDIILNSDLIGGTKVRNLLRSFVSAKETQDNAQQTLKINPNLTVLRAWKKGNIFSILSLFQLIKKLTKVQSVFIQFEFNVFGGILPNLTLLLLIALLRLSGKRVTFELHQVITDVGLLKKHVPIKNKVVQIGYNAGLVLFYRLLGLLANSIVVFEETLKTRLSQFIRADKIEVLCLSVEKKQTLNKRIARQKLKLNSSEFTVLVFGFINGYKGIDWIVNALKDVNSKHEYRKSKPYQNSNINISKRFDNLDLKHSKLSRISDFGFRALKPVRLLVAGGQNPYLKDQPHYQKLYNSIVDEIKKHSHMTYRDFVPDELVTTYFSAADVVVLPYEVFMSASGPFSLALSYAKPVLLSEKLKPYSSSQDVKESLTTAGLSTNDLFFKLNKTDLKSHLIGMQDQDHTNKMTLFSNTLANARASEKIVTRLHTILHSPSPISVPVARLPRFNRGLQLPLQSNGGQAKLKAAQG